MQIAQVMHLAPSPARPLSGAVSLFPFFSLLLSFGGGFVLPKSLDRPKVQVLIVSLVLRSGTPSAFLVSLSFCDGAVYCNLFIYFGCQLSQSSCGRSATACNLKAASLG